MARKDKKNKQAEPDSETAAVVTDGEEVEVVEIDLDSLSEPVQELIRRLGIERDEASAAHQRALADFVNFQRRATENEGRAREEGRSGVIRALLPALDNFDLAVQVDPQSTTLEQFAGGVKMVRDALSSVLEANGIHAVRPEIGAEFDPNRHSAIMQQPTDEVAPGHIVVVTQVGYLQGDRVLRPASVVVAAPLEETPEEVG